MDNKNKVKLIGMPYNVVAVEDRVEVPALIPRDDFLPDFLEKLENYMHEYAYIQNITSGENSLRFIAPPFRFAWNGWNLFNPISNGSFFIHRRGKYYVIEYKIYFWEFFVYSLLFSTIALFGFFPGMIFRFLYLLVVWSFFIFHSLWSKSRLDDYLEKLAERVTEEYFDRHKPRNKIYDKPM